MSKKKKECSFNFRLNYVNAKKKICDDFAQGCIEHRTTGCSIGLLPCPFDKGCDYIKPEDWENFINWEED